MIPRVKPIFEKYAGIFKRHACEPDFLFRDYPTGFRFAYNVRSLLYFFIKEQGWVNKEIVVSAYTCSIIPYIIRLTNNIPVFVDCDNESYSPSVEAVVGIISDDTVAVVITHIYGLEWPVDRFTNVLDDYNLSDEIIIINDRAHCPVRRRILRKNEIDLYSFAYYKLMVSTNLGLLFMAQEKCGLKNNKYNCIHFTDWCEEIKDILAIFLYGTFFKNGVYGFIRHLGVGNPMRAVDLSHAIGTIRATISKCALKNALSSMQHVDENVRDRKRIIKEYNEKINNRLFTQVGPLKFNGISHYPGLVKARSEFIDFCKTNGVDIGIHFANTPLAMSSYFGVKPEDYPNALKLTNHIVNLPLYPSLSNAEIRKVICVVNSYNNIRNG